MNAGPAWLTKNQERPIVLRRRRERIKTTSNWLLFYYHFQRDQAKANLIWNYKTREELREALGEFSMSLKTPFSFFIIAVIP
jgi:hypothetical protein